MVTLQHLITINQLNIEDPFELKVTELAILENTTTKGIKSKPVSEIEKLIEKHRFLYEPNSVQPKGSFFIGDDFYSLPVDLGHLQYAQWEDLQQILKNDRYGENDWEKLPYLLAILTANNKSYSENDISSQLDELSKKFKNLSAFDAIGALRFFQSSEKISLSYTELSLLLKKETLG